MQRTKKSEGKVHHLKQPAAPKSNHNHFKEVMQAIIAIEKGEYQKTLVPFAEQERQMRVSSKEFLLEFFRRMQDGAKVLKAIMEKEEKTNPHLPKESHFSNFEKGTEKLLKKINSPNFHPEKLDHSQMLQEHFGLDAAFMERAYQTANTLFQEKKFKEAYSVYMTLRFLNSDVFEYWFGEATALSAMSKFQEALDIFGFCLLLQPRNPYIYYLMGNCLYQLREKESALKSIDVCLEYSKDIPQLKTLIQEAQNLKKVIKARKAA